MTEWSGMGRRALSVLVVVISLSAFSLFCYPVSADPTMPHAFGGNDLAESTDSLLLFNDDFERDVDGSIPDLGWYGTNCTHANVSFKVDSEGDNQFLNISQHDARGGYIYSATAYVPEAFQIGKVNVSLDVRPIAQNGYTGMEIDFLTHSDNKHRVSLGWDPANSTHVKFGWLIGAVICTLPKNTWATLTLEHDFDAHEVNVYVNGIYMATSPDALADQTSAFFCMRIRPATAGQYCTYNFDNIKVELVRKIAQAIPRVDQRATVTYTSDDGKTEDYTLLKPIMEDYPVTLAICPSAIETGGYMTWAQVQTLVTGGWEAASHGLTHGFMTSMTPTQLDYDLLQGKRQIEENLTGYTVTTMLYPGGYRNYTTDIAAWNYYALIDSPYQFQGRASGDCSNATYFSVDPFDSMWPLVRMISASVYAYNQNIAILTHSWLQNMTAVQYFVDHVTENDTEFISFTESKIYDNAMNALLSGDSSVFDLSYPDDFGNYSFNDTIVESSASTVYGIGLHNVTVNSTYSYLEPGPKWHLLNVATSGYKRITVTIANGIAPVTILAWNTSDPGATNYTLTNLNSHTSYLVYQNGTYLLSGNGPSFSFTGSGGSSFEVRVWQSSQVSNLILFGIDMVLLGIVVSVAAPTVKALRNPRTSAQIKVQTLMRSAIFIVVALVMWGVLLNIAHG